jgi:hypothetical protein
MPAFSCRASTDINKINKRHGSLTEVNSIDYGSLFLLGEVLRQIKADCGAGRVVDATAVG